MTSFTRFFNLCCPDAETLQAGARLRTPPATTQQSFEIDTNKISKANGFV